MKHIPTEVLDQAVADGTLSPEQRLKLLTLAERHAVGDGPEARAGLNPVSIAYSVGALLVVFGFGWFLNERWRDLGPGGVLAITVAFAAVFIVATRMLLQQGFRSAAGWTALFTSTLAPLAVWSMLQLTGVWPPAGSIYFTEPTYMAWLTLTLELAALAAGLVAYRFIAFPHLALEMAVALAITVPSLAIIFFGADFGPRMTTWLLHSMGTGLLAIGYASHRRGAGREFANWFFLIGFICMTIGWVTGWSRYEWSHVLLPIAALLALTAAIYLHSRVFFAFGMLGMFGWLAWLAFEVFRDLASFPVILATFGTVVILLTVWAQRRYPDLVARVRADRGVQTETLPGDYVTATAPFAIAVMLLVLFSGAERERVRTEAAEMRQMQRAAALRRARERQRTEQPPPPQAAPASAPINTP
jgi:hypothetical protein